MPTKLLTPTAPPLAGLAARPNPMHLPALTYVAADLDGTTHPVRIVNPTTLGSCSWCPDGDLSVGEAIATVIGHDPYGHAHLGEVCVLHLHPAVRDHARRERPVVVEVPTCSLRWFLRDDRETFYAVDESHSIVVTRTTIGSWAAWDVHTDGDLASTRVEILRTFPADLGDAASRLDAECWAQDHAARIAADAYEAASVDTVALPVATETRKAA